MIKKWFSIAVIVLILVIVAVTQLPTPAYAQTQGQCWALVVGVSDYQNPVIDDVPSACFTGFYQEIASLWGEDHVLFLQDDQASKQNIKNQIQGWLDSNENAQDTVLVFFSGHGDDGIYVPWDVYSTSGYISDTELKNWLSCLESQKQIIILMSCLSGSFINALSADGRVVLTSSAENESSWGDSTRGAYFTVYLTDGFNAPDTVDSNRDGEVSAEELFEYARPKTTTSAALWFESQHPQIDDSYQGEAALLAKLTVISEHGQTTGSGWYGLFRSVQISISSDMVTINTGTRDIFTGWQTSGAVNDNNPQTSIIVDSAKTVTAVWQKQYRLNVKSAYGKTTWTEWHNANTEAPLSVNAIDDHQDGSRHVFTGWVNSSGTTISTSPEDGVIMDSPQTISASWKKQYFLNIEEGPADPTPLSTQGWYDDGAIVTTGTAPDIEMGGPGTRYVFKNWIVDGTEVPGNTIEITVNSAKEVSPNFETQYYLTVQSDYGQPSEGGWHTTGSVVPVSVTPVEGMLVRHIFTGWSGDITESLPDFQITMNGPRTVTANFRTDYTYLIILIAVVIAVLAAAAILIWWKLRSRKVAPVMSTAAPPAPQMPAVKPPAPEIPAVKPPAPEIPVVKPPTSERPIVKPPAPERPVVKSPTSERPAVRPPAPETPVVKPPTSERPAVIPPAPEIPVVKPPAPEIPIVKPPAPEIPIVKPPAPEIPIVKPPTSERPATTPPAPEIPAVKPPAPRAVVARGRLVFPDNSEILLTEAVRSIGRDDLKKAVSPDASKYISRQHFLIRNDAGRYFIEDLNTSNGTKINGVDIGGKGIYELGDGDRIDVATVVQLTFRTVFPI